MNHFHIFISAEVLSVENPAPLRELPLLLCRNPGMSRKQRVRPVLPYPLQGLRSERANQVRALRPDVLSAPEVH